MDVARANTPGVFAESLRTLEALVPRIKDNIKYDNSLISDLEELKDQWQVLQETLASTFDIQCPLSEILQRFECMKRLKNEFYTLLQRIVEIESDLVRFFDGIESQVADEVEIENLDLLINAFEECWMGLGRLKVLLRSSRYALESGLEFNEILNDLILALDALIDENAEKCFEIKQDVKLSRVSRTSLDGQRRVSSVLSESADTNFSRVPTFSEDSDVFEEFVSITEAMEPLEKNLRHTLYQKIESFGNRQIIHVQYLANILREKYNDLCLKYESLIVVFHLLKEELVNSRWKALFESLNKIVDQDIKTASNMVSELEAYSKLRSSDLARLLSLQDEIENNFNIIYQALDKSVLTVDVADQSNKLADRWLALSLAITELNSHVDTDEDLSSHMQQLSLLRHEPADRRPSQRRTSSVGAFLFKRMNIKPVMIDTTPKSAVKIKSFYQPSESSQPARLNFDSIPHSSQPAEETEETTETELVSHKKPGSSDLISLKKLLRKIQYFSGLRSRIPIYQDHHQNFRSSIRAHLADPMKVVPHSSNLTSGSADFEKCQLPTVCLHKLHLN
ncbi:LAME_0D11122g1_1 [Lachancea meyersii CBS 8951]|uniref:LAME_0D11122g1_1 n=1 Tax=Lachancea meyersii CBS 8951 TaxID=1266667 RepID=A0A1G4JCB3_9SACH|nr:LAME_0D11122g1_1 [Lachancea meyersii CBS 8951]